MKVSENIIVLLYNVLFSCTSNKCVKEHLQGNPEAVIMIKGEFSYQKPCNCK